MTNCNNSKFIIKRLINSKELSNIKFLLNSLDDDFNYWYFMVALIRNNINVVHVDYIINNIFMRLDNIKNHPIILKEIGAELINFGSYHYFNDDTQVKINNLYDKYLNILKNTGFDFNSYHNRGDFRSLLLKHNSELFKTGIRHGISFPKYFMNSLEYYDRYHLFSHIVIPYVKMYRLIRRIEIKGKK